MPIEEDAVYVVLWDHKHSQDISLHKSESSAEAKRLFWMRDTLLTWEDTDYNDIPDNELHLHWTRIAGETEFFSIEKLVLND